MISPRINENQMLWNNRTLNPNNIGRGLAVCIHIHDIKIFTDIVSQIKLHSFGYHMQEIGVYRDIGY